MMPLLCDISMHSVRRHVNIPIFIPHLGCPHACVFCDQRRISGTDAFLAQRMTETIETVLSTVNPADTDVEIAFFGGSFTGIPRPTMLALLKAVQVYLHTGRVSSLRCSTRPDYIDEEILSILRCYGMTTVELGIQSFSDTVLSACRRSHTAETSVLACRAVKKAGLRLIGQMMVGLPESTPADERETAERLRTLSVDGVRIYPTAVFRGTELAYMLARGDYRPLTTEDAVERTADLLEIFGRAPEIPVLRVGLCVEEGLDPADLCGGIYLPAFGEMAASRVFLRRMEAELAAHPSLTAAADKKLFIRVPYKAVSAAAGCHACNKQILRSRYGFRQISLLGDPTLHGYSVVLSETPFPASFHPSSSISD